MINQNSIHGKYGVLELQDRVKVTLHDGTLMEGDISQINNQTENGPAYSGGIYVGSYFVGWERISYLSISYRPTPKEKFELEVAELISRMSWQQRVTPRMYAKDCLPIARRCIAMIREHDAEEAKAAEVTKVTEPRWVRSAPFSEEGATIDSGMAPQGSAEAATGAHIDREDDRVPR